MKITHRSIEAGYEVDDYNLDPPEYDDPKTEEDSAYIELEFNDVPVTIDPTGSWDYESLDWADGPEPHGKWNLEGVDSSISKKVDRNSVVEDIDSLIEPLMPAISGNYNISGTAHLEYTLKTDYYDDEPGRTEIEFNYTDSYVDNFTCTKY